MGKGNYFLEIQEHGLDAQATNSQAVGRTLQDEPVCLS